jgi:hypothetical protein
MSQTSDPVLIYVARWRFSTGEEFEYTARMKESQARFFEKILYEYVNSGYLSESGVDEVGDPISSKDLMKIIKEEFPRTGKEWMP